MKYLKNETFTIKLQIAQKCSQYLSSNTFSIMKLSVINNICVKQLFSFVVSNKRNKPLLTDDKAVIVKGELYQVALEDK